jgi:phosphoserine phosphatase
MPSPSYTLVSFDVDGTIFREPALRRAAHNLGIAEKWDPIDEMYEKKRIDLRTRLKSHYKLLQGMDVLDILQQVSKVPVVNNVRETVEKLQGFRMQVILLTDLPDFLCSYLVEKFGFNGYIASKVAVKGTTITNEIEPLPDKRLGLRKYCAWLSISLSKCVHVGDGQNDVPVFRVVGHSIALNSKFEKVRRSASKILDTDNLLEVYNYITSLQRPSPGGFQ